MAGMSAAVAPARPQNQLEVGPSTILGERTSLIDPVVVAIGRMLDEHAGMLSEAEIELEIRLGTIACGKEGHRLNIPCTTEAVLTKNDGFSYNFVPGLPPELFMALADRLEGICGENAPSERRVECGVKVSKTLDVFYKHQPPAGTEPHPPIRMTYQQKINEAVTGNGKDGTPGSEPEFEIKPRVILKQRLAHVDVYAGRRPGEYGNALDLRAALSSEVQVEGFEPGRDFIIDRKREKVRKTYHFRAWKIDVSNVRTMYPDLPDGTPARPPQDSYEVELELDSYPLTRNLEARSNGGQHRLWDLLSDLLCTARDLAGLACELRPLALPPSQISQSQQNESERGDAMEAVSQPNHGLGVVKPIVGHYLSRIAKEVAPALMGGR
eukprot:TRINITY_DN44656_c0_g1_i1.p1 TRINITY_DN44656_c0_g1~~TRINITY_DN44656_c0_g1_i1.p1  ORF type:complete len:382 (-),score=44.71 TRINITY_DN44656_c0_g1_i1:160-1305(-)